MDLRTFVRSRVSCRIISREGCLFPYDSSWVLGVNPMSDHNLQIFLYPATFKLRQLSPIHNSSRTNYSILSNSNIFSCFHPYSKTSQYSCVKFFHLFMIFYQSITLTYLVVVTCRLYLKHLNIW